MRDRLRSRLAGMRTLTLLIIVVMTDATIAAGAAPLEFFSLRTAATPSSTVPTILALLIANVALLCVVFVGIASSGLLLCRVMQRITHVPRCSRGAG